LKRKKQNNYYMKKLIAKLIKNISLVNIYILRWQP